MHNAVVVALWRLSMGMESTILLVTPLEQMEGRGEA